MKIDTQTASDLALPSLSIALDERRMRSYFERHLAAHDSRCAATVKSCTLNRIRHRRGSRAVLQYELLVDNGVNEIRKQTLTGTIYANKRATHIAKKIALRSSQPESDAISFRSGFAIDDLNMIVQAFPHDRRLPGLAYVHHLSHRSPQCRLACDRLFGSNWEIVDVQSECVRYRSGLAAVFRCVMSAVERETGRENEKVFYAKIFRGSQEAEESHEFLTRLHAASLPVGTVRPLAYLSEWQTILLEAVEGETLEDLFRCGEYDDRMRNVAIALGGFHCGELITSRTHTVDQQIENLNRAASKLRFALPHLSERIDQTLVFAVTIEDAPFGPVHRDLKLEHIFLDDDRVNLIDWDSYAAADPILDTAMLMVRIAAFPIRHGLDETPFRTATALLEDEYFRRVPVEWRRRLAAHWAGAALEVSVGFFGRQEPRWQQIVDRLLRAADARRG